FWLAYIITNERLFYIYIIQSSCVSAYCRQSATINLTPGRVAQSMLSLLVDIGTPAKMPKQMGKSPGWEKERVRTVAPRYPTVKKRVSRRKKSSRLLI
ncbi:hypothetical protein QUB33_28770, partial [Microcoleus sp. B3-A4]|uniref:hypothetical protein n=1 Tax=Microcoleus sp. B3-A4 TaxID=2818653 RepID=UPI002FCEB9ED